MSFKCKYTFFYSVQFSIIIMMIIHPSPQGVMCHKAGFIRGVFRGHRIGQKFSVDTADTRSGGCLPPQAKRFPQAYPCLSSSKASRVRINRQFLGIQGLRRDFAQGQFLNVEFCQPLRSGKNFPQTPPTRGRAVVYLPRRDTARRLSLVKSPLR